VTQGHEEFDKGINVLIAFLKKNMKKIEDLVLDQPVIIYFLSFFPYVPQTQPTLFVVCLLRFLFLPVQELQSKLEELNTYLIQSDVPQSPAVSVKQDRALSTSETPPETPETTKLPQNNRFSDALRNIFGKPKTDNVGAES